jgi:4-amino-4-deoxy-L-arabinose transferase-like glycosyltransferase
MRRVHALLGALLAAHAALAWTLHQRLIILSGDDASYLMLARSLRDWSYREQQFIGEPVAGRFPPVYPAAVALWTWMFGESLDAIAVLGILASVSMLLAFFLILRRRWSGELALLVVAITAVNPPLVRAAGATASEALFTSLTMWSLWAAGTDDEPIASRRRAFVAGAAAILAAMTRSAGVTLIAALGLEWLVRRRWTRVALLTVGTTLTVGLWLGWTAFAPKRDFRRSYVDDAVNVRAGDGSLVGTFTTRITDNAREYVGRAMAGELSLPVTEASMLDNVGWFLFIAFFGVIGFVSVWRRWRRGALYAVAYAGMLAVWPYAIERFITPVLPLLIAFIVIGAWVIAENLTSRYAHAVPFVVGLVLAGSALVRDGVLAERDAECARTITACDIPAGLDYVDAVKFVATLPASESRLVTPKSATLFYYAGRQSPFWDEVRALDPAEFRPYLERHGIRYVIAGPLIHDYDVLYQHLLANCEYFDLVRAYSQDTFIVVVRETPREDGRQAPVCIRTARALARPRVS